MKNNFNGRDGNGYQPLTGCKMKNKAKAVTQKITVEQKAKRFAWVIFSRTLALCCGASFCLIGMMIAEDLISSKGSIMVWGFLVISASADAYRAIIKITK